MRLIYEGKDQHAKEHFRFLCKIALTLYLVKKRKNFNFLNEKDKLFDTALILFFTTDLINEQGMQIYTRTKCFPGLMAKFKITAICSVFADTRGLNDLIFQLITTDHEKTLRPYKTSVPGNWYDN